MTTASICRSSSRDRFTQRRPPTDAGGRVCCPVSHLTRVKAAEARCSRPPVGSTAGLAVDNAVLADLQAREPESVGRRISRAGSIEGEAASARARTMLQPGRRR